MNWRKHGANLVESSLNSLHLDSYALLLGMLFMYFEYFDYFHIGNHSDVDILHKIDFFFQVDG